MSRESEMIVIGCDKAGKPTIWCDPEIVDLVKALNDGGLPTVSSCSGHGERYGSIALKDGRCLMILPDLEEHNKVFKRLHLNSERQE